MQRGIQQGNKDTKNIMKILSNNYSRGILLTTRQGNNCFGHNGHHQVMAGMAETIVLPRHQ
jgi:hypothetical protein